MSEAELHLIRSRLTAGLRQRPPVANSQFAGRVRLRRGGEVIITPDEAVVEAIATVFRRFADLGTGRQVLLPLRERRVLLLRRPTRTGRVSWQPATIRRCTTSSPTRSMPARSRSAGPAPRNASTPAARWCSAL